MISVDLDANVAIINGKPLRLQAKKAELLWALMCEWPRSIEMDRLKTALWGAAEGPYQSDNLLHVHLCLLRKKLRPLNVEILGDKASGYSLVEDAGR